jgi:hypothetical protein
MRIKYVGVKEDGETAFSHQSGVDRWMIGDENEVKDDVAKRMLLHPDVFAFVDDLVEVASISIHQSDPSDVDASGLTLEPGAVVQTTPQASIVVNGKVTDLTDMDSSELKELAKELKVAVHHASGAAKVIEALQAAFPAETQPAE